MNKLLEATDECPEHSLRGYRCTLHCDPLLPPLPDPCGPLSKRFTCDSAHTSPGWCCTSVHWVRAGPGLPPRDPELLFRGISKTLVVSVMESFTVAAKDLPGGKKFNRWFIACLSRELSQCHVCHMQ